MPKETGRELVESIIGRNRYLVLATSDGADPWVAPLEYMSDDDLNLYFFSPEDTRHGRDLEKNSKVAVAIFEQEQPEYSADASFTLNGIQAEATVRKVPPEDYSEAITAAIDALDPPMPPYAVYRITPERFFIPRIEDGVNLREQVGQET